MRKPARDDGHPGALPAAGVLEHSKSSLRQLAAIQAAGANWLETGAKDTPTTSRIRLETSDIASRALPFGADEAEDDLSSQRLAERFARRTPEPVRVREQAVMHGFGPYSVAIALAVFGGLVGGLYLFNGEGELPWSVAESARAAVTSTNKTDTAALFEPVTKPLISEPAQDDGDASSETVSDSWAQALEVFKTLSAAKTRPASVTTTDAHAQAVNKSEFLGAWKSSQKAAQ